jgi:hypothetical protein
MSLNEYLNSFIQLLRCTTNDINTDEKKQDMLLNGLNGDIQFQLLNTDYIDFYNMVDKAIVIENKIKEMDAVFRKLSITISRGSPHSPDSLSEVMLGPTSRNLTSSSDPYR